MIHYSVSNIFHHSLSFVARKTCLHLVRNSLCYINFQQYTYINSLVPGSVVCAQLHQRNSTGKHLWVHLFFPARNLFLKILPFFIQEVFYKWQIPSLDKNYPVYFSNNSNNLSFYSYCLASKGVHHR